MSNQLSTRDAAENHRKENFTAESQRREVNYYNIFQLSVSVSPRFSFADGLFGHVSMPMRRTILIYGIGVFNWDKPEFGNYGIQSAGMFGMLPPYLKALGYGVRVDSVLNRENLDSADIVMIINLNKNMPPSEKNELERFVYNGGSLLVIGDHTGLGGIMRPLNDLLRFVGVRYRFDCGHWLVDDWRDAFEFPASPVFGRVRDESDIAISIGASLDFSPANTTPILFAKYGFSDRGNPLNAQNAYLGNRSYDPGELLGDIMLVARTTYGKGKVLVFGDTSSFQNDAMIYSFQFVRNVLDWLTTSDATAENLVRWMSNLLMLSGLILLFTIGRSLKQPGTVMASILSVLLLWVVLTPWQKRTSDFRHLTSPLPIAYVDASHLNRFTQYSDDAIWPLTHNLIRNGYLPFVCRKFTPVLLEQSKIAFFIAPEKKLSADETQEIDHYMKGGGIVVWSAGEETSDASMPMLKKMELSLDNIPLGPVSDSAAAANFAVKPVGITVKNFSTGTIVSVMDSSGIRPEFHSAWPIISTGDQKVDTLCTGWGYPVIVSKSVGKGRFVLISDSDFLLSGNLESKIEKPYRQTVLGSNEMVFRGLLKAITEVNSKY
ncbi:MAG: hypothetical protein M1470_03375 [Bacteroidetes bacterium]|nr:hypothetical protein [Bacteroidota bacterium]MCL5737791.1 hypothetical protein [Bacteroidota bacterium]